MNNKRQISYQNLINVLERKRRASRLLQAVARMKLHQKLSGKSLNIVVQPLSFSDFAPAIFLLFSAVKSTLIQNIFYNVKFQIIWQEYFLIRKLGAFLNSEIQRKLLHFTVTIDVSVLLTSQVVLLLFHKQ